MAKTWPKWTFLEGWRLQLTILLETYLVLFVHPIAFPQVGAAAGAQGCSGFYMVGVIPFYKASKNKYILFFVHLFSYNFQKPADPPTCGSSDVICTAVQCTTV